MNTKFVKIEVLILERLLVLNSFGVFLCVVHGRRMVRLA
jgi:hypothetical protein